MSKPDTERFVADVLSRIGPRGVTTIADDLAPWSVDWRGRYRGAACALLSPASTQEVVAIVEASREHRVALVPQGGNTSMVGGATPGPDGTSAILSLRRMNRIRDLSADAGTAIAEAGVILSELHDAAAGIGCRFPLTLGARGSATIGGLISTNAGGTQVLRFGTMRALVAGIEAVLPSGEVHDGLAPLKKDNRGYSIDQLLIGAEGTLGVVTAATLRLVPAIVDRGVAWVGLKTPHAALALLRRLERATDRIESFEIIPGDSLALVIDHIPGTRAPLAGGHAWHVLIEAVATDDSGESPARLLERLLADALGDGVGDDAVVAASEAQADAMWRIRDSLSEAERAAGPAVQHDISVPVAKMPDFMIDGAAAMERAWPGTHATAFGHLGDGNVHFHVRAPAGVDRDTWYARDGHRITAMVHDLVIAAGGSISAEHGIGQMKRDELARLSDPARMTALRAIKSAFDPFGLFNPGKLVTLAQAPDAS